MVTASLCCITKNPLGYINHLFWVTWPSLIKAIMERVHTYYPKRLFEFHTLCSFPSFRLLKKKPWSHTYNWGISSKTKHGLSRLLCPHEFAAYLFGRDYAGCRVRREGQDVSSLGGGVQWAEALVSNPVSKLCSHEWHDLGHGEYLDPLRLSLRCWKRAIIMATPQNCFIVFSPWSGT